MSESVSICLSCGLCCNGVLFRAVDVMADEIETIQRHGLVLAQEEHHFSFHQPCACHVNSACAIYANRPFTCRAFTCKLLQHVQNGTLDPDASRATIRQVRELLQRVEEQIDPRNPAQRVWETIKGTLSRLERERDTTHKDELARDAAELRRLCEEYFGPIER